MRGMMAALVLGLVLPVLAGGQARAERIELRISISQQRMDVYHEGRKIHEWPVSTAKRGSVTPLGIYKPQFLSRDHRSKRYGNAPMPHSIFYSGNYAIHGTMQEKYLGRPASHGCVRLSRRNARILFDMVRYEGMANVRVNIVR